MQHTINDQTRLSVDGNPCTWAEFLVANNGEGQLCAADIRAIRDDLETRGWCRWDMDLMIVLDSFEGQIPVYTPAPEDWCRGT